MNSGRALPRARYEPNEGSPSLVVLSAGALAVAIGIVLVVAAWVSQHHHGRMTSTSAALSFAQGPHMRTSIARDWVIQDAAVREHLQSYGWNDRAAGVVRIPIDRAIEVISGEAEAQPQKEAP